MAEEEPKGRSPQEGEPAGEAQKKEDVPAAKRPTTEEKKAEPSPPQELIKADIGKRALAAIVDIVISYVIGLIPVIGWLIGAAYMALRDGFTFEPVDGQSLGKKLVNVRAVVASTGQRCDYMLSIKRNLPFIIPMIFMVIPVIGWLIGAILWVVAIVIEVILVITDENGERIGDKIAGTRVVEIKA
jgi:uncharacterized RDD family membrane protein YckC